MKTDPKFISFDVEGMNHVDEMVTALLKASISSMNEKAKNMPSVYKKMSGSAVEVFSYRSMCDVAPSVNFPKKKIELISGQVFPDMVLHDTKYGVEIKSTQKDQWTSTGSSIVESTRYANTDRIYMLFGKLGGTPEFKCKPYQQCLSNIAVTHSPRYLINMDLNDKDNIFAKMNMDYDVFRLLKENEKITRVRSYYLQKAKREHRYEMPWWMDETTNVNLSFYNDLSTNRKKEIQARACILFKSLYETDNHNRYRPISLWLCNSYSLLCPNMRDDFSAGGSCKKINGQVLTKPYPHIVLELLKNREIIEALLKHPDEDLIRDIHEFWDFQYHVNDLYKSWLTMVENCFVSNNSLSFVPILKLLYSKAKPY